MPNNQSAQITALKLRMLRIDRGLSRDALAREADVSHPTIKRLEEGELPSERIALKIANYFGTTPLDMWPELANDDKVAA